MELGKIKLSITLDPAVVQKLPKQNRSYAIETILKQHYQKEGADQLYSFIKHKLASEGLIGQPNQVNQPNMPQDKLQQELQSMRREYPNRTFDIRDGEVCMYNQFYKQWKPINEIEDWG